MGLYDLEMILPQGCNFWMGGLAYDISSQTAEVETDDATTISMAEEAENASSVGDNRAYSNGKSRKDECSSSQRTRTGDGGS